MLGKFVCCSTSLASGIALGREGPSVHIGSGIASVIARRLGLSTRQVRWLIPVGASAALAAAFNTPIAAVLFSLEEIMGDMHAPILGSVVLSSTTSWMVLHLVLGDEPLFHVAGVPSRQSVASCSSTSCSASSEDSAPSRSCGCCSGCAKRSHVCRSATVWIQPVAGGLCVGLLGYFVPQVLGVGYDQVDRVLSGDLVLHALVLLAVLKIIATAVCYASGNAGGIFGPSMFIGAMMGAAVGQVAHTLFAGDDGRSRRVRAGRHGHRVRRHHPHAADVGDHDLRGHAQLHDHRAADDLESHRVLHLAEVPARADLRSARRGRTACICRAVSSAHCRDNCE